MQDRKLFRLIGALAAGLAYFAILMGLSMALAGVNASVSPNIPWFPVPALVGITAVTIWVQRYWPLRLNRPSPTHTNRLYALALCATLAAMCISLIEASMHGLTQWRWHLDEVFVRINGETSYLWRAVDHEGEVLEVFVTKKRDCKAALKFLRKAMKRYGSPQVIVTDRC